MSESSPSTPKKRGALAAMPRWKKLLLATAALCVLVGAGLKGWAMVSGRDSTEPSTTTNSGTGEGRSGALSTGRGGLIDSNRDGSGTEGGDTGSGISGDQAQDWSPFFFKGGFGFFVGFCVGHFLRAFLKISALGLGLLFLVLLGLQYADLVDVNWESVSTYYDKVSEVVRRESQEFFTFVNGTIPSAAAAAVGVLSGFKKK